MKNETENMRTTKKEIEKNKVISVKMEIARKHVYDTDVQLVSISDREWWELAINPCRAIKSDIWNNKEREKATESETPKIQERARRTGK